MSAPAIEFIDLAAQRRRLGERIDAAISRVLAHGRFILGPEVAELEEKLQAFSGARHCVTCANGTDAIELGLTALDVGRGDAVVVPAFTYVATAEAVVNVGATPIFADCDVATFNINPESAEAAIAAAKAAGLRPRCVMPVDLFGQLADYEAIGAIARAHGLSVLADAAQAFGASMNGKRAGALADVTITSFYPAKPLGCYGDGGALFTGDSAIAERVRSMRFHGMAKSGGGFERIGRNSRLDTVQAAVLLVKLEAFEEEIAARNRAAARYAATLPPALAVPQLAPGAVSVWAQYTVKVEAGRDAIAAACRANGVPIAVHYAAPLHRHPPYRAFPRASENLKNVEALAQRVMSLPMHADLDEATQARIVDGVCHALASYESRSAHAVP